MTYEEIKTAVNWLMENKPYKLFQWTADLFGAFGFMHDLLAEGKNNRFAEEISKYGLDIQLELVELMY